MPSLGQLKTPWSTPCRQAFISGVNTLLAGGYSLFIKDGELHYVYNYLGRKMFRIDSADGVPEGDVTVVYTFEVTGEPDIRQGNGSPGIGRLFLNGTTVGQVEMDVTVPLLFSAEGMSIGYDYGDSVDHESYKPPYRFGGTIKSVIFDLSGHAVKTLKLKLVTPCPNSEPAQRESRVIQQLTQRQQLQHP